MKRAKTSQIQVLRRMWIDGESFQLVRFSNKDEFFNKTEMGPSSPSKECRYEINTNEEGKLRTTFKIPAIYIKSLRRFPFWNANASSIENITNTSIKTTLNPEPLCVITGLSKDEIVRSRDILQSVFGEIRNGMAPLQFVSIRTISDEIIANFNKFKREILDGEPVKGMHESIFQLPNKLHLTLAVFVLVEDKEKEEAIRTLQECKTEIFDPFLKAMAPIKIQVFGVNCMQSNPEKANVLYSNPKIVNTDQDLNLQTIANQISQRFYEKGLLKKQEDNVTLHMTLINTKYRNVDRERRGRKDKRWVRRETFDASSIIEKFKDYYFGECDLSAVEISIMTSIGDDGFYKPLAIVKLDS